VKRFTLNKLFAVVYFVALALGIGNLMFGGAWTAFFYGFKQPWSVIEPGVPRCEEYKAALVASGNREQGYGDVGVPAAAFGAWTGVVFRGAAVFGGIVVGILIWDGKGFVASREAGQGEGKT